MPEEKDKGRDFSLALKKTDTVIHYLSFRTGKGEMDVEGQWYATKNTYLLPKFQN
jgi:hypothetical protein